MYFKPSIIAWAAAYLLPVLAQTVPEPGAIDEPKVVPATYIVEFEEGGSTASAGNSFFANLTKNDIEAKPRLQINDPLFQGVSFKLAKDSTESVETINNFRQVKKIWPVRAYARPHAAIPRVVTGNELKKRKPDTPFAPHIMGGVEKLHKQGLYGDGIKVAVIDTGIDYKHPALGGGFGPGFKVVGGRDLVGDEYTGENTPVPDDDPMDCDGHGTHVAGTVAAGWDDPNVLGVAPNATLYAYKVFGCPKALNGESGSAANDVLIDAFISAYNDGVDIITSSIGGVNGWPEDPWAAVVDRIVSRGTPCTISNGNDGSEGLFYSSGAADARGAIGIGAINNVNSPSVLTSAKYKAGSEEKKFGYTPATKETFGDITLPIIHSAANVDGCAEFPAGTKFDGGLALVKRGTCTFDIKAGNAAAAGAKYLMFYNNVPGTIAASVSVPNIIAGMVPPEIGEGWVKALAAGEKVEATFTPGAPVTITETVNNVNGGKMATFSTWGLTNEMGIKPEVSSPGGNILSTYPLFKGSYAVLSGTSMACPYAAGSLALYLQHVKKTGGKFQSPKDYSAMMATTATPVKFSDGTDKAYEELAPIVQQGGGLLNPLAMINSELQSSISHISVNDTANIKDSYEFSLTNIGKDFLSLSLGHEGAGTAYVLAANGSNPQVFPPEFTPQKAVVHVKPENARFQPGQTRKFQVYVRYPRKVEQKRIPVYSGYITVKKVTGYRSETVLRIPYAGVATDMKTVAIFDRSNGLPSLMGGNGTAIIRYRLSMGSQIVRADVKSLSDEKENKQEILGDKFVGSVTGFPRFWNPRKAAGEANSFIFDNKADDLKLKPGSYSIVMRARKLNGDEKDPEDYDTWESEPITVE